MRKMKVIVILGQTATGKSDLAVKIALWLNSKQTKKNKRNGAEIISADSRQVYKGLNIGTGKVSRDKVVPKTYFHKGISHHLLDVVDPKKKFSVVEYQKTTISAMADIVKRNKIPIICGGTGFYIDAITKGIIFPEVPPNNKLRQELSKNTAEQNFKILKKLDKIRAKNIDVKNNVRLIRAIEIAKYLNKVPKLVIKIPNNLKFIKIGLYLPPDILKEKIEKRVKKMFKDGLLKEIKNLKKSGISEKRLKELGFEYYKPTEEKVIKETFKYAKRQITWFKRDKDIKWFNASIKNIQKTILAKLKKDF